MCQNKHKFRLHFVKPNQNVHDSAVGSNETPQINVLHNIRFLEESKTNTCSN